MFQPPTVMAAQGDWDDLAASVQVGAEQCEMVIARLPTHADASPARFELRTSLNEPVIVEASRERTRAGSVGGVGGGEGGTAGDAGAQGLGPPCDLISLRAGVGRFGDESRERALLQKIARRLNDLRGVEFAPIRE